MNKPKQREIIENFFKSFDTENKIKIIKSLKGYSEVTDKVQKYIKDNGSNYIFIGKLLIKKEVESLINKNEDKKLEIFFAQEENYSFIYSEDDFNKFLSLTKNKNIKNNDSINFFYEKSKIDKSDKLTLLLETYSNLDKKKYKNKKAILIHKINLISKLNDKTLRTALNLDINGFKNSKERYRLYQNTGEDQDLKNLLNSISDSKLQNITDIKDLKEVK